MDDGMDELIEEFLVESFENLDQLDRDLVALEQDPSDLEVLKSIFRTIHTIKGTCGFLGYSELESITHVGENLLALLRDGVASVDADITSALLAMTDAVRLILTTIEGTREEGDADHGPLVTTLSLLEEKARSGAAGADTENAAAAEPEAEVEPEAGADAPPAPVAVRAEGPPLVGELLVEHGVAREVDVAVGLIQQESGDDRQIGKILVDSGVVGQSQLADALNEQQELRSTVADRGLRVDVSLLDSLMNLVGELVLVRNQILQHVSVNQASDTGFVGTAQRLSMITTELQTGVMKTRMQPIGNVWSKFPRVVRDLATQCGKRIRIEMEGKETELDKTIIEAIKDPLTHIVRNSVDHGIETPDERASAGKPAEGLLRLRAYHEGGQVNIEISDDGLGIDVERVKAKAVERGLVTAEQAARMGDREAVNMVFLPGFSTVEQVSNLSGRGVGMDVVRTNIEKIGGSLDLQSRAGQGTTIKVKIPLTLAIVPALIVRTSGERFAIPQTDLLELVGLGPEQVATAIEQVHDVPVYRLRGKLLPLVHLDRELGLEPDAEVGARRAVTIVVLRADDRDFGLVVDGVNDTQEIVVKPLAPQLKGIRAFSGCTIMGDGQVALILDILGLAQRAGVVAETHARAAHEGTGGAHDGSTPLETLLVLEAGGGRVAIPLALVDRLEEFARSSVEHTSGREVVQYRETVLSLLELGPIVGGMGGAGDDSTMSVVVCSRQGRLVGLVVDRVLDIVEVPLTLHGTSDRYGVVGALVVQGVVTDLLDVHEIIRSVDPSFFEESSPVTQEVLSHA